MPLSPDSSLVLRQKKLSEQVYEQLERRIVNGSAPPGTHISEDTIAREFGISRSPVRQAIAELERRGLAEWADKRDRRVAVPSVQFAADVFDTCTLLESGRVYNSSRSAPVGDHAQLKSRLAAMTRARSRGKSDEYQKHLGALREILVRRCDNERLNQLSREFETYRQWILTISYPNQSAVYHSEREHRNIVRCYIARDLSGLMEAIEAHSAHHRKAVLAALDPQASPLKYKPRRASATRVR